MSLFKKLRTPKKQLAGFTLLEVMIAVVILAVGLSSLFTSEAGAIRIAQRARTTTVATLLARCKMAEVEEKIFKEGWPGDLIEGNDECCEDGAHDGFKCDWKVERIKLPDLEEDEDEESTGKDKKGDSLFDKIAGINKQEPGAKFTSITDSLGGGAAGLINGGTGLTDSTKKDPRNPLGKDSNDSLAGSESDPMFRMVMGIAMPVIKPVIEEGARRASVVVHWKEGSREQSFEVVQFMVSEQQIILPDLNEDDGGVPAQAGGAGGSTTTTTGSTGSSGARSTGTGTK